ncbi:MAG: hypothetical protein Q4B57_08585 [Eubacteriales bacterium]|nr:hypothetical protein [Eubacteriales bacterium]
MISENIQKILFDNIHIYEEKNNKDYFICFSIGKNHVPEYEEICFRSENYWHLLACKLHEGENEQIYAKCLNGEDITKYIGIAEGHTLKDVYEKEKVFKGVFDFVRRAKEVKIAYANGADQDTFTMAIGKDNIVGYGRPKGCNTGLMFPKSCQTKSIGRITRVPKKILFILSKQKTESKYTQVEYIASKKEPFIHNQIINECFSELELFDLK